MTDDIVKRLRYGLIDTNTSYRYQQEAADEIEKLRAENKALTEQSWVIDGALLSEREENDALRAAGEGVVKWWLDKGGCWPFDDAPYALFALRKALGDSRDKAALEETGE